MLRHALLATCAALITLASPLHVGAQAPAAPDLDLPPALAPWVGWVLHGEHAAFCPEVGEERLCAWPALLELDLHAEGGRFRLDVMVEREGPVALPGSVEHWPQQVTLDGKAAVVLDGPHVRVPAGRHQLAGTLQWQALPESLQTPANVGRVSLRIDGEAVATPRHESNGLLWLRGSQDQSDATQRLEVEVYRRIEDGVPARIVTRLALAVGGKRREVVIDGALLEGTRPLTLDGSLPVRLEPDGSLRVQVAPGEHRVELTAIAPTPPDQLTAPTPEGVWSEREIWVFVADAALREVETTGAPRIDPARTNLAADWRGLPTFVLKPGAHLGFETRRRGEAQPSPNALDLRRDLWLDLDGQGYTVRDHIRGSMHRDFRLDLAAGELGRAAVRGDDQLVTLHEGARGLEVRDSDLDLLAEWRLAREGGSVPAVGWSNDMGQVHTTLHLPPGWSLLGGDGADGIAGTLLDDWDLWSFFFVLLVALASAKLAGWSWGGVALLALALCTHQPNAPEGVWLWLVGALALSRLALPGAWGKAARVLLGLSLLSAVLTLVPFAVHQLRFALYPQVGASEPLEPAWLREAREADGEASSFIQEEGVMESEEAPPPMAPEPEPERKRARAGGGAMKSSALDLRSLNALGDGSSEGYLQEEKAREAEQLDAGAVVQTGPGVPQWSWDSYPISIAGPVRHDHTLSLWLLPPGLSRLLAVLRVLLAGVLLFGLLRASRRSLKPTGGSGASHAAAAAALLLALGWAGSVHAQPEPSTAQDPVDPQLLEELQRRLLEPPACAPSCLSVASLAVQVREGELQLRSEVHAAAVVGYQAPGPLASFTPAEVRVDGKPAGALARLHDGFLRVRLTPGVHVVELRGPFPGSDELTLQLGSAPRHVRVDAPDFEVDGVRENGRAEGSIQLRRRVQSEGELEANAELPPWLRVRRHFDVGSRLRVVTTVERVGRASTAVLLRLPLLEGETVTQSDVQEQDGVALVRLAPGQPLTRFTTALTPRSQLVLKAPEPDEAQPYSVVWELSCSTFFHCTAEGIAPITRQQGGRYRPEFQPYPGETLTWTLQRLAPAEGQSATIDSAELEVQPGERLTRAVLHLSQRNSAGSTLAVDVPDDAELVSLQVDGEPRATELSQGRLELALEPGAHSVQAELRMPRGMGSHYVAPAVTVDGALVNVHVRIAMPEGRWLLWAHGPDWGPAVLFWGVLLAFVAFALVLSRVPHSPLRAHQWVLLSLGLTQIPVPAALVIVGWFFAVRVRERRPPEAAWLFNLAQIALVMLTFAAAATLAEAIHEGLVVRPEMQVAGGGSHAGELVWYVDRSQGALPRPGVFSLPLWVYRGLMLAWALWLASQALRWLRWAWEAFSEGGRWRMLPRKVLGRRTEVAAGQDPAPQPATASPQAGAREEGADDEPGDVER